MAGIGYGGYCYGRESAYQYHPSSNQYPQAYPNGQYRLNAPPPGSYPPQLWYLQCDQNGQSPGAYLPQPYLPQGHPSGAHPPLPPQPYSPLPPDVPYQGKQSHSEITDQRAPEKIKELLAGSGVFRKGGFWFVADSEHHFSKCTQEQFKQDNRIVICKWINQVPSTSPNDIDGVTISNIKKAERKGNIFQLLHNCEKAHLGSIKIWNVAIKRLLEINASFEEIDLVYQSVPIEMRNILIKNTILQVYYKQKKTEKSLELWEEIKKSGDADIVTKNIMIKIFHELGRYEDAVALFQKIQPREVNIFIKTTMLQVYHKSQNTGALFTLWEEIKKSGEADIVTKNKMLKIFHERENYDDALDLWEEIKVSGKANIVTKNTMLKIFHKLRKDKEALDLWQDIKVSGKADIFTKNTMLKIFHKLRKDKEVLDLLEDIKVSGKADIATKNTMLKIFYDLEKYDEAIAIFKTIRPGEADGFTNSIMLKIYHKHGKITALHALWDKIKDSKNADIVEKNTMLKIFQEREEYDAVAALWKEIKVSGKANIVTKSTMINSLNALERCDESLKIFNQYCKMSEFDDTLDSNILLNGVVQSYLGLKNLKEACRFFDEAQDFKSDAIKNTGKEDTLDASKLRNVEGSTDMLEIDLHERQYGIAKILVYKALLEAQKNKKSLNIITGSHQRIASKDQSMKQEIIKFLKSVEVPYKEDPYNDGILTCF